MSNLISFSCLILVLISQVYSVHGFIWLDCWTPICYPFTSTSEKAIHKRFRWDILCGDCIEIPCNGCRPTNNHFETKKQCLAIAGPVCKIDFSKPWKIPPPLHIPSHIPPPPQPKIKHHHPQE